VQQPKLSNRVFPWWSKEADTNADRDELLDDVNPDVVYT
jgi:hypothetical protein